MERRMHAPALDFAALRRELGLTEDFPDAVRAEAERTADRYAAARVDRTDLELVTIDPPGSKDLDQALRVQSDGDGFLVHYAIADVAALVVPGGAIDEESRRRGQTVYFPDGNVPLHPRELSENAGSLLPDRDRAAVLWTIGVDGDGNTGEVHVQRATVRSRARLDYAGVSADHAAGRLHPAIAGLPGFGATRSRWALDRGAVQLDLPDQEVVPAGPGHSRRWTLRLAPRTEVDKWNEQVSLLTGMCAGAMMFDAGLGLLRTLPAASGEAVDELRAVAANLRVPWPDGASPGEFLAGLTPGEPSTLALMSAGLRLMRGAGYRALGAGERTPPVDKSVHAGVGGLYAHVTAPLRRLADRFATEACLSIAAGEPAPDWVAAALPDLGSIMSGSDSVSSTAARKSIDLAEATVLADQLGARFGATVMRDADGKRPAEIFIPEPAVVGPCAPAPSAGSECTVTVTAADPAAGTIAFAEVPE
ncbi:RNB domain-containing ribonuclease [Gordonia sp. VNK21]|uniref:RNB domain-containing ribonuclease n=1 Tax=Gordonia sp. VNK21 TaxID=3382483 RepID=UPI0038D3DBDD